MPGGKKYPKDKRSRAFISAKIKTLLKEGKKKNQAIAIAIDMARRKKRYG